MDLVSQIIADPTIIREIPSFWKEFPLLTKSQLTDYLNKNDLEVKPELATRIFGQYQDVNSPATITTDFFSNDLLINFFLQYIQNLTKINILIEIYIEGRLIDNKGGVKTGLIFSRKNLGNIIDTKIDIERIFYYIIDTHRKINQNASFLHGQLLPENILIDINGYPMMSNFSYSRLLVNFPSGKTKLIPGWGNIEYEIKEDKLIQNDEYYIVTIETDLKRRLERGIPVPVSIDHYFLIVSCLMIPEFKEDFFGDGTSIEKYWVPLWNSDIYNIVTEKIRQTRISNPKFDDVVLFLKDLPLKKNPVFN